MAPGDNLALIGAMGAGKSTLAVAIGGRVNRPVIDLDRAIEATEGSTIAQMFERFGEAHFRAQEHAVLEALLATHGRIIACGGGVVLAERNRELLRKRCFVVWLDAPIELLHARLADDVTRPLLRTPNAAGRLAGLLAERAPHYRDTADLHFHIDSGPVDAQAARLLAELPLAWQSVSDGSGRGDA